MIGRCTKCKNGLIDLIFCFTNSHNMYGIGLKKIFLGKDGYQMKKFNWILLLLILVLISFPVLAADHQLPYFESFKDITSGWEISSDKDGSSGYVEDGYELNINKKDILRQTEAPVLLPEICIVQAKMRISSGKGIYGLFLNNGKGEGYFFVVVPSSQKYQIAAIDSSNSAQTLKDPTYSDAINPDGANIIKIIVQKKQVKLYVNNNLLISIALNNLSGDKHIQVIAKSLSDNATVHIDNFVVTESEDEVDNNNFRVKTVDFSSPNQGFADGDYFKIRNGVYRFVGGDPDSFYWEDFSQSISSDFTAQVKARWDSGSKKDGFGLIFRITDNKHYYLFKIADGSYYLGKHGSDGWESLVKWQRTNLIKTGFNLLTVTCKGSSIKCYLNEQLVINIQDDQPDSDNSKVGVGSDGDVMCTFDDFSITTALSDYDNTKMVDFSTKNQGFAETDCFKIQNDVLRFNGGIEGKFSCARFSEAVSQNFTVAVRAIWDDGEEDTSFGLVFRYKNINSFYYFKIINDGYYGLSKSVKSGWEELVELQETNLIQPGFNLLQVACRGRSIKCYLNGQMVINIQDDLPDSDKLMVGVGANSGVKCSFDDLMVKEN